MQSIAEQKEARMGTGVAHRTILLTQNEEVGRSGLKIS